jgi:uncharacterized protein (DUF433 family)
MRDIQYTPQEAAAVSGASLAYIQKAITMQKLPVQAAGLAKRRQLDRTAVLAIALSEVLPKDIHLSVETTYGFLLKGLAEGDELVVGDMVRIDTRKALKETRERLALYERARELIVCDPEIMGGAPTIRGTRITAHAVAGRLDDGDSIESILEDYPYLDRETVEAAALYAKANPPRGRPKSIEG